MNTEQSYTDIKSIILTAIENKKQKTIKEYDDRIIQIKNENNITNIYYSIADTFGNSYEQRELGIKVLQSYLTNPFFLESEITKGCNYIVFSNNDFDVMFSTHLNREIRIEYKNVGSYPNYCSITNMNIDKLADLIEIYLNHKSIKNFKALVNHNCRGYANNIIGTILKYINTYKKCNKTMLQNIRDKQEYSRIKKIEVDKKNKEYEDRQLYAKEFIESLTDLEVFKTNEWHIKMIGIKDENGKISWR